MTIAIHQIPPAPRHPRWAAVLWHRWPLALGGFVLAVYGGLWTLMFWFAAAGKPSDDLRLDEGAARAPGTITAVEPIDVTWDGYPADHVRYRFEPRPGVGEVGECFVRRGSCEVDDEVAIELIPEEPHVSRVLGGRIGLLPDFAAPAFRLTVLPGLALLVVWLISVLRLRHVLAHGDIAVAELTEVQRVPLVIPPMLRVDFRFRNHRAEVVDGRHWVRENSVLGQRVLSPPRKLPVAHGRRLVRLYRLVVPEYFAFAKPRVRIPDALPDDL